MILAGAFFQSGQADLDAILATTSEVSLGDVVQGATVLTGLGLTATDAGVFIVCMVTAMKLIDANKGLFITFNDWVRRRLNLDGPPHRFPGPPDKGR